MSTALIRRPVVRPSAPPSSSLREFRFTTIRIQLESMERMARPLDSARKEVIDRLIAEARYQLKELEAGR